VSGYEYIKVNGIEELKIPGPTPNSFDLDSCYIDQIQLLIKEMTI